MTKKLKFALFGNVYQERKSAAVQKFFSVTAEREASIAIPEPFFHFLKDNQIFTVEELERQTHELSAAVNDLVAQSKANTARIKQLDNMITFAEHIRRIQPIIDEMNAIHWKGRREKFQAAHQNDIDLYYTSQRILKEKQGVKKIDIPGWKKEQVALQQKEIDRAAQYEPLREKLNQLLNVKYCVDVSQKERRSQEHSTHVKKKDHHMLD